MASKIAIRPIISRYNTRCGLYSEKYLSRSVEELTLVGGGRAYNLGEMALTWDFTECYTDK